MMNIDFQTIAPIIPILISLLGIIGVVIFTLQHGGNLIHLRDRMWRIVAGKKESSFYSHELSDFHRSNMDIDHFNAIYKTKATSLNEIDNFLHWIKSNNLNIFEISRNRKYFDIKTLNFTKIKLSLKIIPIVFIIFIIALTLFTVTLGLNKSALVQFRENNSWIWINKDSAMNFPNLTFKHRWEITSQDCNTNDFNIELWKEKLQFSDTIVKVICDSFSSKKDQDYISNIIRNQTYILLFNFLHIYYLYLIIIELMKYRTPNTLEIKVKNINNKKRSKLKLKLLL